MLRIDLRPYPKGRTYEWSSCGFTARTLSSLARKLKLGGVVDQPFHVYRGDQHCMTGTSLHSVAKQTLVESDRDGLQYVKHTEFPGELKVLKKKLSLSTSVGGIRLDVCAKREGRDFVAKL